MWKKGESGNKAGKPVGTKSKTKTQIRELRDFFCLSSLR
jgi:hypothetical protein